MRSTSTSALLCSSSSRSCSWLICASNRLRSSWIWLRSGVRLLISSRYSSRSLSKARRNRSETAKSSCA
ncbi:hypothetical protein DERF_011020 [Dermatophagoides farinae]|uniref:Uncharacterized protein n=1 Tax=Dermatophagoides farinae TaxID=6954 RepID=A0A922HS31_DERFA|nr:hypothetical protein DERF_011020 [Dermatophagoides farinae]